jgi:hypothetical protein
VPTNTPSILPDRHHPRSATRSSDCTLHGLDNVELAVIPFSTRLPLTPLHGFWIFDGKLVLVETLSAELSLRDAEDVALYIKVFEKMWERATHGEKVAEHINTAVQDLAPHRA